MAVTGPKVLRAKQRMGIVEKMISGVAAFLWLIPPLLFLHIWPLPMPQQELNEIWLHYFVFTVAAYLLFRWLNPDMGGILLVIGICVIALAIEIFNVVYFHHGDGESFRTAHLLAAFFGVGLGTTLRKFPNRWNMVIAAAPSGIGSAIDEEAVS